jgi:hypothetical protein
MTLAERLKARYRVWHADAGTTGIVFPSQAEFWRAMHR